MIFSKDFLTAEAKDELEKIKMIQFLKQVIRKKVKHMNFKSLKQ